MSTPTPTAFRMLSHSVIEPGDILLANTTGRCWRVETARQVRRRTPTAYPYTWSLTVTRFSSDELARHLDLGDERGRPTDAPWHADLPGGRVAVHPFDRTRHR